MKYLGIDIGTTGGKVALFSETMELLACYRQDYRTYIGEGGAGGEHDPKDWWEALKQGIPQVLKDASVRPEEIAGIGISSMTPVLLPLDQNGNALMRAWLWYDKRAAKIAKEISTKENQELFFRVSGSVCSEVSFLAKYLYFRKEYQACYRETAAFLQANNYLAYRMTGKLFMDRSHGEILLLTDKRTGTYSREVMKRFSIDPDKFPPLLNSDAICGALTKEAARELGLAEGTPVIAGGHDSALSAFALGMEQDGQACLDLGNAGNLICCCSRAVFCPASDVYRHVLPDKWLFQIYSATIGAALRWYKELFGREEEREAVENGLSVYDELCRQASQSPAGAGGVQFFPYLQGARQAPDLQGSFQNLNLGIKKEDMIRALLEGCAMSIRYNMEQMEKALGREMEEITVCGGGSKNTFWLQIYADICKRPLIRRPIREAAVTGAALLAWRAVEKGPADMRREQEEQSRKSQERIVPRAEQAAVYEQFYQSYKEELERQICSRNDSLQGVYPSEG